jgi:hypothetical protein
VRTVEGQCTHIISFTINAPRHEVRVFERVEDKDIAIQTPVVIKLRGVSCAAKDGGAGTEEDGPCAPPRPLSAKCARSFESSSQLQHSSSFSRSPNVAAQNTADEFSARKFLHTVNTLRNMKRNHVKCQKPQPLPQSQLTAEPTTQHSPCSSKSTTPTHLFIPHFPSRNDEHNTNHKFQDGSEKVSRPSLNEYFLSE